jgi:transposase-like protein
MELSEIKSQLLNLPAIELTRFIQELQELSTAEASAYSCQQWRRELLNNKQGSCSHCGHTKYVKFGSKSGSQRYKCKSCNRCFTEYSGTWMSGIHHKNKIDDYLQLMVKEKSLDKIKLALSINKKTAFDWRHKILSSLCENDNNDFTGITESDETFFRNSEKGRKVTGRKSRKRGSRSKTKGISQDQVAVIVTQDRKSNLDLTVATMGRLKKIDIENAIGKRIKSEQVILCSDAHVSYKGFAIDNEIEHHALKAIIKQRVKNKIYHIQHVNSTHNRLKKWIDNVFWGVSTKYLQQYLNWYKIKEHLKQSTQLARDFSEKTTQDITALIKFKQIQVEYEKLIINPILN